MSETVLKYKQEMIDLLDGNAVEIATDDITWFSRVLSATLLATIEGLEATIRLHTADKILYGKRLATILEQLTYTENYKFLSSAHERAWVLSHMDPAKVLERGNALVPVRHLESPLVLPELGSLFSFKEQGVVHKGILTAVSTIVTSPHFTQYCLEKQDWFVYNINNCTGV